MDEQARRVTDAFHQLYYASHVWQTTYWRGVLTAKCPLDLWTYQEVIHEVKPDVIVECGTHKGGSALFFADTCAAIGKGKIVTVDVTQVPDRPSHPRIKYISGSSVDPNVVAQIRAEIGPSDAVMVSLDSDHSADHVLAELRTYGDLVTSGSYLVVEDTNINGHPILQGWGRGPMEAIDAFLKTTDRFVVDAGREKFLLSFNPNGWLRAR